MVMINPCLLRMREKDESEYYEIGQPGSFGKPPRPPTPEETAAFFEMAEQYRRDPEMMTKLLRGQDPDLNQALQLISRDRFFSAFPDLAEGVGFFVENIPPMMNMYGLKENTDPFSANIPFYDEIINGLWHDQSQIGIGGMERLYISLDRPPEQQSYEYIGEMIGRAARKRFSQDRSYKTGAFFGWIGRQVMKRVCPQTDFSFDRHLVMAEKERIKVNRFLAEALGQIEKGIGKLETAQQAYDFFGDIRCQLPRLSGAGTPLELRVADRLWTDWDVGDDLPEIAESWHGFERFKNDWQQAAQIGIPEVQIKYPWEQDCFQEKGVLSYEDWISWLQKTVPSLTDDYYQGLLDLLKKHGTSEISSLPKEEVLGWYEQKETQKERKWANLDLYYWQKCYSHIFGEIVFHPEKMVGVTDEELLPMWFNMHLFNLKESLQDTLKSADEFKTSYFRFIENPTIAAGYAFAQQQIEEILVNLPEITRMPEEEIFQRFFKGQPPILSDEGDFGRNTFDDMYKTEPGDELWSFDILQLMSEEEKKWAFEICHGPNAELYKELETFVFTEEQWELGVLPLFFGFSQSDQHAEAFLAGEQEENVYYQRIQTQNPLERERERIEELENGSFCLPQTPKDLLVNAGLQIQRLRSAGASSKTQLRVKTLLEVKEIIQELINKGMIGLQG